MNQKILYEYIYNFFGYGSLKNPLWFIGMEEGVGEESLDDRLQAWETLGKTSTVDIRQFHRLISEQRWFDGKLFQQPQIQKTWKGPTLASLAFNDLPIGKEAVRSYQINKLATNDLALLELMPLPHKNLASWDHYHIFRDKATYRVTVAPKRISWLKSKIKENSPKAVIMYGTTPPYPDYWLEITEGSLTPREDWAYKKTERTLYIVCKHPVARGITDSYFISIGEFIREVVSRS